MANLISRVVKHLVSSCPLVATASAVHYFVKQSRHFESGVVSNVRLDKAP